MRFPLLIKPIVQIFATIFIMNMALSCTSELPVELQDNSSELSLLDIVMSKADTSKTVSEQQAKSIAVQFNKTNGTASRSNFVGVNNIQTIYDSVGNPSIYIANFANDCGFVIVSANRGYFPVIAHSDNGHFDLSDRNHPAHLWIDEQQQNIANCDELPQTVKEAIAAEWTKYAEEETLTIDSRTAVEKPQVYYDSLRKWSVSGEYKVYTYNEFLLTEEYNSLMDDQKRQIDVNMHSYGNSNYGGVEEVTVVLVRDYINRINYPEKLLQTQWGQSFPYNVSQPDFYPLGCTTIAAGQIMRYHEWPNYYNWANMPTNPYNATATTQQFLYDLALTIDVEFHEDSTTATIDQVRAALIKNGYTVTKQNHNLSKVKDEIMSKRPVYMRGDSHAWVCDGARDFNSYHQIRVMSVEYRPTTYYEPTTMVEVYKHDKQYNGVNLQLHMNWGWYGSGDGYFYDGNVSVDVNGVKHSFNKNRKELLISPNR